MNTRINNKSNRRLSSRPDHLSNTGSLAAEQPAPATSGSPLPPAPLAQPPAAPSAASQPGGPALVSVDFQQREQNRSLAAGQVLVQLRQVAPRAYDLAEVVGQWVWVTFPDQPEQPVRAQLSQLGFHWNNARKCWQHPCGQFRSHVSDPRQRYGSHFAADQQAA
jgi:hypothetical protein